MHKRVASNTHRKRHFIHTSHTPQEATCERQRWMHDTPTTTSNDRLRVKRQEEAKRKGRKRGSTTETNTRECQPAPGSPQILVMSQLQTFIHATPTICRVVQVTRTVFRSLDKGALSVCGFQENLDNEKKHTFKDGNKAACVAPHVLVLATRTFPVRVTRHHNEQTWARAHTRCQLTIRRNEGILIDVTKPRA